MECKVLNGLRVIEISEYIAGPSAAMFLAQMGAEVIKIENRDNIGLRTFALGPAAVGYDPNTEGFDQSVPFNYVNNNKLSAQLNIKTEKGREILKSLLKTSDVFVQNLRPGTLDKMGLGYDVLKDINPGLIMLGSSGFGAEGPFKNYGGYAWNFSCFGGLAHLTGYEDMAPNQLTSGTDMWNGYANALSIMIALNNRQKTGKGQFIDLSQSETVASMTGEALMDYSMNKRVAGRCGNEERGKIINDCYPCSGENQWVSISISNEKEWEAFCKAIDKEEWLSDDRFSDNFQRLLNRQILDVGIGEYTKKYTKYEVMKNLQSAGIQSMPSLSNIDLLKDEHVKHRNLFQEMDYSGTKQLAMAPPFRFSEEEIDIKRAPKLGENTEYVFNTILGMDLEEIEKLKEEKVLY